MHGFVEIALIFESIADIWATPLRWQDARTEQKRSDTFAAPKSEWHDWDGGAQDLSKQSE